MANVQHYVLTLSGAAQRLSEALPDTTPNGVDDVGLRYISLQPDGANANPIFVGGSTVSATSWGIRLPAASGAVPPPPYVPVAYERGPVRLSNLWVFGTGAEKLHILAIEY